jgi:hypothetical protein
MKRSLKESQAKIIAELSKLIEKGYSLSSKQVVKASEKLDKIIICLQKEKINK